MKSRALAHFMASHPRQEPTRPLLPRDNSRALLHGYCVVKPRTRINRINDSQVRGREISYSDLSFFWTFFAASGFFLVLGFFEKYLPPLRFSRSGPTTIVSLSFA